MKNKGKLIIGLIIITFIIVCIGLYCVYREKDNTLRYYTKEEVMNLLDEISFVNIAEGIYTYEQILKFYEFEKVYNNIDDKFKMGIVSDVNKEFDINGVPYGDYKKMGPEHTAKLLGFTVDAINKMDKSFFDDSYNVLYAFKTIDGEEFKRVYKELYGDTDIFNKTFIIKEPVYSLTYGVMPPIPTYMYDINMNKVIIYGKLFSISDKNRFIEIIDEKENNKEYIIEFVQGTFYMKRNGDYVLNGIDVDLEKPPTNEEKERIFKENKDKLKKYKVIFNKTRKGYTYKGIS